MTFEEILTKIRSGEVRDFCPESNSISLAVDYTRGPGSEGGIAHIKATLKPREMDPSVQPNVVFVIDQSGSMQGYNQQAAIRVFETVYNALCDNTQVSIILFNQEAKTLHIPLSHGATGLRGLKSEIDSPSLLRSLAAQPPTGGTNIIGALKATAAVISQSADMKPTKAQIDNTSIIFITDGNDNGFSKYADLSGEAPSVVGPAAPVAPMPGHPPVLGAIPGMPPVEPPKPTLDIMLRVLKREMEKEYGTSHFARIMPIGIGVQYDEQLLMGIGEDTHFHRTGFLHIAHAREVQSKQVELVTTVDPVRVKTQLFIAYRDGTHALFLDVYLQRGVEAAKEYFLESAKIKEIYLIQEHDETHHEITRIVSDIPPHERVPYNESLLRGYLMAESAGIINRCSKCEDKTQFPELLQMIKTLLHHFPVDFWGKDEKCKESLESLNKFYVQLSDTLAGRPAPQVLSAAGAGTFFNQRESLLQTASGVSRAISVSMASSSMPLPSFPSPKNA